MSASRSISFDRYVFDVLMRDLVGHDRQPSAYLVYLFLSAQSFEAPKERLAISLRDIADGTGLSKSIVQIALQTLKRRQLVSASAMHATAVPTYVVLRPWDRSGTGRRR